jgi:hypothetical protein
MGRLIAACEGREIRSVRLALMVPTQAGLQHIRTADFPEQ